MGRAFSAKMRAYRINTTEIIAARTMGDALKYFDDIHGIEEAHPAVQGERL
jgi:hypothetical protein